MTTSAEHRYSGLEDDPVGNMGLGFWLMAFPFLVVAVAVMVWSTFRQRAEQRRKLRDPFFWMCPVGGHTEVCGCGDEMDGHATYWDGHQATSVGCCYCYAVPEQLAEQKAKVTV